VPAVLTRKRALGVRAVPVSVVHITTQRHVQGHLPVARAGERLQKGQGGNVASHVLQQGGTAEAACTAQGPEHMSKGWIACHAAVNSTNA